MIVTLSMAKFFWSSRTAFAIIALLLACLAPAAAQLDGSPGAYARMGFGARGMGMANAMVAVNTGEISTYYNPALSAFSADRTGAASASFLSFDRTLNFISYTQAIKPTAGLSAGIINAGVHNIDGRDEDGQQTEQYSTTDDQFFLSFSNRVDPRVSLGVAVKLYYSKLFDKVSSTTVGFDIGAFFQLTDDIGIGAAVQDLNSKYKWDTQSLYGQPEGMTSDAKFPNLRKIGVSYRAFSGQALLAAEYENSSLGSNLFRAGVEYSPVEAFTLRAGVDRMDGSSTSTGAKPTFGFSLKNALHGWTPGIHYAFVVEPYASHGIHILTVSTAF